MDMREKIHFYEFDPQWGSAKVHEKVLKRLQVDIRSICLPKSDKLKIRDENGHKSFIDEYGIKWSIAKGKGLYYDMIAHRYPGRLQWAT